MHPLPVPTEQTQDFYGAVTSATEPVFSTRVELGGLPGFQNHIVVSHDQPQPTGQNVQLFDALVSSGHRCRMVGRQDHLECLPGPGKVRQRHHYHPFSSHGSRMNPGIANRRGTHQFIER